MKWYTRIAKKHSIDLLSFNLLYIPLRTINKNGACLPRADSVDELTDWICDLLDVACSNCYDEDFEFDFNLSDFNIDVPTIIIFKRGHRNLRVFLHEVVHAYDLIDMPFDDMEYVDDWHKSPKFAYYSQLWGLSLLSLEQLQQP